MSQEQRKLAAFRFKVKDKKEWEKLAKAEGRSLTNFIEHLCNKAVEESKKSAG